MEKPAPFAEAQLLWFLDGSIDSKLTYVCSADILGVLGASFIDEQLRRARELLGTVSWEAPLLA